MDPSDPIYRAMMAAARAPAVKAELNGGFGTASPSATQSPGSGVSGGLFSKAPAKRNAGALRAAFAADEEEAPKRELKKLSYTPEELAAAQVRCSCPPCLSFGFVWQGACCSVV